MSMYNLIKYSYNYSKTSGILWKFCNNKLDLNASNAITDFNVNHATPDSFKMKEKIAVKTGNSDRTDIEVMVPLKYLSNFRRSLKMSQINCEINFDAWCKNCVILTNNADQATAISIADTKPYVPNVTLSAQDNAKLLEHLKSGFK